MLLKCHFFPKLICLLNLNCVLALVVWSPYKTAGWALPLTWRVSVRGPGDTACCTLVAPRLGGDASRFCQLSLAT